MPLHHTRQQRTCTDGALEKGEAQVKEPPVQRSAPAESSAFQDEEGVVRWRDGPVYEVPRQRSYAPLWTESRENRADPCSECPPWRRVPPYVSSSCAGGRAVVLLSDSEQEARTYGRVFAWDARRGYVRSHIHKCKKTCFKKSLKFGNESGVAQVCRFNFVHGRDVLWYPRRWPGKISPCKSLHCSFRASGDGIPLCGVCDTSQPSDNVGPLELRACLNRDKPVHEHCCPADVPTGLVRRLARMGKRLVLPCGKSHLPHVCLDEAFGGVGKVNVLRYHPDCSSSHPALQVCFRCNFDVQCTDRVFVCSALREVIRRRRVKKSSQNAQSEPSGTTAGTVPSDSVQSSVGVTQQQPAATVPPLLFKPSFRIPLRGGAGIDDAEDFDFMNQEDPEPSDLELFTENAQAPQFEDFFEDEYLEGSGVPIPPSGDVDRAASCVSDVSRPSAPGTGSFVSPVDAPDFRDDPIPDLLGDLEDEGTVEDRGFQRVKLKIQRHWSDLIAEGKKTVEGRPNIGRPKTVNVGDYLLLNDVQCKVLRKRTYRSFRAMLEAQVQVDDVTPGVELEDAVKIYHGFPNYEKLAEEHGVVAFDIELTPDQPEFAEKPVIVEQKVLEEYNVSPDQEHLVDWSRQRPWWQTAYEAFKRSYRVMSNLAHYQTDYATKSNPMMGNELSEQCIGIERLRKEEVRDGVRKNTTVEVMEAGRKTLIRLQTAANRSALKKLPEMVFQMLFRHECYQSHQSWTIFCRGLMWEAFCAGEWKKQASAQEDWTPGVAWSDEKASLMDEVRKAEADYSNIDADVDEQGLHEPQESGQLRVSGSRQPRSRRGAATSSSASCLPDSDSDCEAEDDEQAAEAGANVTVRVASDRSMKQDWLYRGDREPLASMGLYHYSLFVYTTHVSAKAVAADDFHMYRFADGHPDASRRVQRLRVHELCRVPKLMGFTMPREDGASSDRFRNSMFKSCLFRTAYPVDGTSRKHELAAAMLSWVDSHGDYTSNWKTWWDAQSELADRFEELQRRSQRSFSISDIMCNVGYMQQLGDRKFPSAAEFMAHITMEAATHLEIGAQSRAGRTVCPEFDAGDFGTDAGIGKSEGYADADQRDAVDVDDSASAMQTRALHGIDAVDARSVALMQEFAPDPRLVSYFNDFEEVMSPDLRDGIGGGHECAADSVGHFDFGNSLSLDDREFDSCKQKQKEAFKYAVELDAAVPESDEIVTGHVSNGFINWNPCSDPGLAELVAAEKPRAVAYVDAAIRQLGTGTRPVFLNEEQRDFLALVTAHVRDWELYNAAKQSHVLEAVEPAPMRILLCGPGGAGKSELVKVVRGLCEFCFGAGSHKALAASNSAARAIGGDTLHSGLHLGGRNNMSHSEVSMNPTQGVIDAWRDVHCLMLEEISMIHPQQLAGASYRLCKVRQKLDRWQSNPELYDSDHMFGRMPLVIMLGDFMQLAPIDLVRNRVSLIMPPKDSWPEMIVTGQRIFAEGITHSVFLRETHRFKSWNAETQKYEECPILPKLLEYMRNPAGRELPPAVARAFRQWEVKNRSDPRRNRREILEGYEMAIAWHAVARMMQYRALREASAKNRILVYVQAVDTCTKQRLDASQYRKALQVVNLTHTGKLMGMCPLFVGMKVRLNAKLSAKHGLVHDAPGEVVGFQFDPREDLSWQQPGHNASKVGHVVLRHLPKAVYVKFKDCDVDVGFGVGVVAVAPCSAHWKFKTHEQLTGQRMPTTLGMNRRQIPLAPEKVRTCQTAQGLSMDACTMYLNKPGTFTGRDGEDDYWMHLYVMLSRVRSSKNVLAYSLPDINFLGRGPPGWMRDGIAALEYSAYQSRDAVQDARQSIDWSARDFPEPAPEDLNFCLRRWTERNRNLRLSQGFVRQSTASDKTRKAKQFQRTRAGVSARVNSSKKPAGASPSGTGSAVSTARSTSVPDSNTRRASAAQTASQESTAGASAVSAGVSAAGQLESKKRLAGSRGSVVDPSTNSVDPVVKSARSTGATSSAASSSAVSSVVRDAASVVSPSQPSPSGVDVNTGGTSGATGGSSSSSSSSVRSDPQIFHQACYKALSYLFESDAKRSVSEPAVYASLLRRLNPERVVMYYGLTSADFEVASVCRQVCSKGLPNAGNDCFINAALHCFLRLDIVAKILAAHKSRHIQARPSSGVTCAACSLADLASAMRSGSLSSAKDIVDLVRCGDFGHDFRTRVSSSGTCQDAFRPPCDASELFLGPEMFRQNNCAYPGFIGVLNRFEEHDFWGGVPVLDAHDVNEVSQKRHVLDSQVFGILIRTRKSCLLCGHVVDVMSPETSLALRLRSGEVSSTQALSLVSMIERELGRDSVDSGCKCCNCCVAQGPSQILLRRYIEREPPVLVISLRRIVSDGSRQVKLHARVQFPEVLDCMRTGEYHLSGVILHRGNLSSSDHYRAVTWHGGDSYWLYDDAKQAQSISWAQMGSPEFQSQCYMLVYVRTRFWNGIAIDGSEHTPYSRDAFSVSFLDSSSATVDASPSVPSQPRVLCQSSPGSQTRVDSDNAMSAVVEIDEQDLVDEERVASSSSKRKVAQLSVSETPEPAVVSSRLKGKARVSSQHGNGVDGSIDHRGRAQLPDSTSDRPCLRRSARNAQSRVQPAASQDSQTRQTARDAPTKARSID